MEIRKKQLAPITEIVDVKKPTKNRSRRAIKHFFVRKNLPQLVVVVLILLLGFLAYQYVQARNDLKRAQDTEQAALGEAEDLAKEIGKFLELPQDETPTVATVNDKQKLQSQLFFEKAENGDKVLIYTKAGRAVLYRPSTKKIIEYVPVDLGGEAIEDPNKPDQ